MDVRMPDGVVLRGIPDGTSKQQIMSKYNQSKLKKQNPSEYDPKSPEFKAKYGALSGMSDDDVFMAGAGKAVVDTGRGLKQIGSWLADKVTGGNRYETSVANQDEVNARDAELMASGNGLGGNITGNVATMLLPAGAAARAPGVVGKVGQAVVNPQSIKAAAAVGAGMGALQPVGTDESRLKNVGIGALTSGATQGVVQGIGKIAQPVKSALSPVDDNAVKTLESAGVKLDAAQKTGSERLAQLKRFLGDNPVTASGQVKQAEQTASSFTRAALKTIGENADAADETTVANAFDRIGKEFDRIATSNPITADNKLLNDLVKVSQGASAELETAQSAVITRQVDEIVNKAGSGKIDGKAYQSIKGVLDRISGGPNAQLGHWARELRSSLDDALERSASQSDISALKTARTQYRNLQGVVKAVKPDGNVSPSKLYNAMNTNAYGGKKAMATGRGTDLMKLAKAGSRIIPERMPNSGTPSRAMLQAAAPTLVGAGYGFSQDPSLEGALKGGAVGLGAAGVPWLAQKAFNNPAMANYLAHGASPAVQGLLRAPQAAYPLRQVPAAGLLALQPEE